jgi:heat-inducible transcriptional repressor
MAELEAGGYLVQPHTSAGRIPSDAGYRTYVDHLMRPEPLATEDVRRIQDEFRAATRELDEVIDQTTRLLGQLSRNVAFAIAPLRETQTFRHIQLIWLSERTGLAIVVTSLGVNAQTPFDHGDDVEADDLTRLSNRLNHAFGGSLMREIAFAKIAVIVSDAGLGADITHVVEEAFRAASRSEEPTIVASGAQHLLEQPEFQDLRKLRSILRIIEEQKSLYQLVSDSIETSTPNVKIGHEIGSEEMIECSIVTVPYTLGGGSVGVLAILGPRRMPYARLLSLATGTADSLNRHLTDAEIR